MKRILLASQNPGKLRELSELLAPHGIQVLSPADRGGLTPVVEDGDTLESNAAKKAVSAFRDTSEVCLADDSGLFVEALDGRPGVYSARYAGEEQDAAKNRARILGEVEGAANRRASFQCVLALAFSEDRVEFFRGECPGTIAPREHGSGGFGYDSIFVPEGFTETFAQMAPQDKNALSHRGKAFEKFIEFIETQTHTQI